MFLLLLYNNTSNLTDINMETTIAESIGKKLQEFRKQKGLSQEQVADNLNISQPVYARIENGIGTSWAIYLNNICEFFEIEPEKLVERTTNVIQENKDQKGGVAVNQNIGTIQLSEKLIEQYEERLKEKDEIIKDLRKRSQ